MDQIMHVLAEHFVNLPVSQKAQAGWVAKGASVVEVNSVNSFGGGVEKKSEPILAFAQRLFRALSLSDVGHHANHSHHLAVRVEGSPSRVFQPYDIPVKIQH